MALNVVFTNKEKQLVSFVPADKNEVEVKAEEPVAFAVVSGSITVDPQADGVSAYIVSGDVAEEASVSVVSKSGAVVSSVAVSVTDGGVVEPATHFIETSALPVPKESPLASSRRSGGPGVTFSGK